MIDKNLIEITPRQYGTQRLLADIYRYRELIVVLGRRDIRVRYAQTLAGVSWAVIQPLVMLAIFVMVFGKGLQLDASPLPYPVFALIGVVSWSFFAFTLRESSGSIVASGDMIKKIYFPRLIIPLSKTIVPFVEFCVGLLLIAALMFWHQTTPGNYVFILPFIVLLLVVCALAGGLWFSALSIRYRDFQHIVPFIVQTGLYASPVVYPSSIIPEKWRFVYHLNPMAGIIEGMRCALAGAPFPEYLWLSALIALVMFAGGLAFFFRAEKVVADYV